MATLCTGVHLYGHCPTGEHNNSKLAAATSTALRPAVIRRENCGVIHAALVLVDAQTGKKIERRRYDKSSSCGFGIARRHMLNAAQRDGYQIVEDRSW